MSQQELLTAVVNALERLGVAYMVTGSLVSSIQGEPRLTHDIDLVVNFTPETIDPLVQTFGPPDYYLSREAIADAIRTKSTCNLLSLTEGEKVDFWMLTDEPFDVSRFGRKTQKDIFGLRLKVSLPEDTILAKLRWAKIAGGSEKQFTDALRVFEVQKANLDLDYLTTWVKQLGVEDLWQKLQAEAEPL